LEWQDLNLIQTIDIAQGGSDKRAHCLGKTRSKQAEILASLFSPSFSQVLRMVACRRQIEKSPLAQIEMSLSTASVGEYWADDGDYDEPD
jgi:hypothetical protein